MKKYVRYSLIIVILILVVFLGINYAFFNYTRTGSNQKEIAGSLYLTLNEGGDSINLVNIMPETKEEARSRNDNYITFSINGKNTSTNKEIFYEILLNEGTSINNKDRISDKDLIFDLVEVGSNNEETIILDAVSYDTLQDQKIWVDKVDKNTNQEIERTYKLRMWISDDVIVSDTLPDANYTTAEFSEMYANVKVSVYGDMNEKVLPLTVRTDPSYVRRNEAYFLNTIENVETENAQDIFVLTITSSNSNVQFKDNTLSTPVVSSTFNKSYTILANQSTNFELSLISTNGKEQITDLSFTLTKNGTTVQQMVKHVTVPGDEKEKVTIEYIDQEAVYSGSPVTIGNATVQYQNTQLDGSTTYSGTVNYSYYMGSGCDEKELSNPPTVVGNYSIKVTVPEGANNASATKCVKLTVNKANTAVTISNTGGTYDRTQKPVTVNSEFETDLKYYTNSTCTEGETDVPPTNAGTYYAKAVVIADSNHNTSDSGCVNHTILPKPINDAELSYITTTYDGTAKEPATTVNDDIICLDPGIDYDVTYANNTNVGNASATIVMKGNYTGTINKPFEITKVIPTVVIEEDTLTYTGLPVSVESVEVTPNVNGNITYTYYSDSACTIETTVSDGSGAEATGGAPKFVRMDNDDVTSWYVIATVAATSNSYAASSSCTEHEITPATPVVTLEDKTETYSGNALIANTATVALQNNEQFNGTITYTYYDNDTCEEGETTIAPTDAGEYYVIASFDAPNTNYFDGRSACTSHTINPADIALASYTGVTDVDYTGDEIFQEPELTYNNMTLEEEVDFTYGYLDNVNAGTSTIVITALEDGNYTGTKSITFNINKANLAITCTSGLTYNGTPQELATCSFNGVDIDELTPTYPITISNNQGTNAGTYTVSCGDGEHNFNTVTDNTCSIGNATPVVSLSPKTTVYTGSAIPANTATVTLQNNETYSGSKIYKYYTDSECTTGETTTAPTNAGNYYVQATTPAFENYDEGESSCVAHKISKATLTITCTNNIYTGSQVTIATCSSDSSAKGTISGDKQTAVGSYTVTCNGSSTTNFNNASKTCRLTSGITASITSTANLKATSQTFTLKCQGTSSSKVKSYYFGTDNPASTTVTYTSITAAESYTKTQSVTTYGTYYLSCKNAANDVDTVSQVVRRYVVRNYLNNTTGSTHTTTDYTQASSKSYYVPNGTTLTIASIYTVPTGSNANKFEGFSTAAASADTEATINTASTYKLSSNITMPMWFTRNLVHVRYRTNGGTLTPTTTSDAGTVYTWTQSSAENVYVATNGGTSVILEKKIRYGADTLDLANYNNSKYLNITKSGYTTIAANEWICASGCTTSNKVFSHASITLTTPSGGSVPSDAVCNAASDDCIAYVKVNWKTIASQGSCNSLTYNGSSRTLVSNGTGVTYSNNTRTLAGTQTVTATAKSGYAFSDRTTTKTLSCTIGTKSLTVTAKSKTAEYTGSAISVSGCTASGLASGDSISCSNSVSRTSLGSSTNSVASGNVTISGNGSKSCYNITYKSGTLKIQDTTAPTCSMSINSSGVVTATYSDKHGVTAKGFTTSYGGETTKTISKTTSLTYRVKDSSGNAGSCSKTFQRQKKTQSCSTGKTCAKAGCASTGNANTLWTAYYSYTQNGTRHGPSVAGRGSTEANAERGCQSYASACGSSTIPNCTNFTCEASCTNGYAASAADCGCATWASASWTNVSTCTASTTNTTKITCQWK